MCFQKLNIKRQKYILKMISFVNKYQFDFQVAVQEQMNIREGRPSSFVGSRDVRAPAVINDRFLQQVFSATMPGGRSARSSTPGPMPRSITGILGYIINMVFQYCYSTISSILGAFLGGNEERSKCF